MLIVNSRFAPANFNFFPVIAMAYKTKNTVFFFKKYTLYPIFSAPCPA
jgi:hypothetical protein